MKYLLIYEKTQTGYSAYLPDLPGCISTGPTLEVTERLMKEAIEFHLDGLREDGLPIPPALKMRSLPHWTCSVAWGRTGSSSEAR